MAEQFIYGVDGELYVGGKKISYMNGWTINITPGVGETPDMGSSGPKRAYTKYNDFSGSINALQRIVTPTTDNDTTPTQEDITMQFVSGGTPSEAMAKFIESSKSMYYGKVVFTNIAKGQSAEGFQSWSGDWAQSNGPLAHATGTAT